MRRGNTVDHRVGRPRLRCGPLVGGLSHDFKLRDRACLLAGGGAEAVATGVAAADDDDILVGGENLTGDFLAEGDPVGLRKVFHGLMDSTMLAARNRQVAADGGTDSEHDGVIAIAQSRTGQRLTDGDTAAEDGALALHLLDATVDVDLLHLEFRNAIAKKSTRFVVALVDGDGMTGARQLLGNGQTCGARPHDRDGFAGEPLGRFGPDVVLIPRLLDDRDLDVFDRHRFAVDRDHARRLTRGRAEPSGEFGEVVGRMQAVDRVVPVVTPHQIVPLGDQVAQRAAVEAERDAAVHAASGLLGDDRQQSPAYATGIDLVPVIDALADGSTLRALARGFHESSWVSHLRPPPSSLRWSLRR